MRRDFWGRATKTDTCWLWNGTKSSTGYGVVKINGKSVFAHRHAYELTKGPIPPGKLVLHSCDVRPCIRPDHLSAGTHADNNRDTHARGRQPHRAKTHCIGGHEFTQQNTVNYGGHRQCLICRRASIREAARRLRARRKLAASSVSNH